MDCLPFHGKYPSKNLTFDNFKNNKNKYVHLKYTTFEIYSIASHYFVLLTRVSHFSTFVTKLHKKPFACIGQNTFQIALDLKCGRQVRLNTAFAGFFLYSPRKIITHLLTKNVGRLKSITYLDTYHHRLFGEIVLLRRKKILLFQNWINCNISYVYDIFDENGNILGNLILQKPQLKNNWMDWLNFAN